MRAYGTLSRLLGRQLTAHRPTFPSEVDGRSGWKAVDVNADLLLKRLWVGGDPAEAEAEIALRNAQLATVAAACGALPSGLLPALHRRRWLAAEGIAGRHGPGWQCRAMILTPLWRVVVGHGEDSVHESSLTLSPTYGIPVFPGSALKGVAAACARTTPDAAIRRIFGGPRPGEDADDAGQGSVVVFDALPTVAPTVVVDVLTPHVKPYYDHANDKDGPTAPPAEYHNPVPVRFLAVQHTPFRALLVGPTADLDTFTDLLRDGLDEFGLGGKTSAGYGYCTAEVEAVDV